jgi:repressor LexA
MKIVKDETSLTNTQKEVLDFIKKRMALKGISPSFREIQDHFGYKSIGTVQDHLKALLKKGALFRADSKEPRQARGLVPSDHKPQTSRVLPVYGEIAAGSARQSEQLELGFVTVAEEVVKGPSFALRVVGNSMVDAGIFEGDILIVERESYVRDGDIVAALVDGETTVKRYRRLDGKIFLVPENKRMRPIQILHQEFQIQGKVVGLQRRF